jgi:hypothetical protein
MIIAVDFDGTIVEDKYPEIGKLKPFAKWVINALRHEGYYMILWTSRRDKELLEAKEFLLKEGIIFDAFNESNPENIAKYGCDTRKIFADLYIDDKNLMPLQSWNEIYNLVHKRLPTYVDKLINDEQ